MHDLFLLVVGMVVGCMNAIAGGGMLIGFPAMLALGFSPLVANATSYVAIIPGQVMAVSGYRRYLRKLPRQYLFLLIPVFVGSTVGASLLRGTSNTQFVRLVPLLIIFAVLLFAIQPLLHWHFHRDIKKGRRDFKLLLITSLIIMPIAAYGGFFGPGWGFLMLAFLGFTSLQDVHQMNGIKSFAGGAIALAAALTLAGSHLIDWRGWHSNGRRQLLGRLRWRASVAAIFITCYTNRRHRDRPDSRILSGLTRLLI